MFRFLTILGFGSLVLATLPYSTLGQEKNKTELPSTGLGTLTGTVFYDGELPPVKDFREVIARSQAKEFFLKSPGKALLDPTWVINKTNKGVANVVVWLKPPPGTFFKIPDMDKVRQDIVILDRPHCNYAPHVLTLFPSYFEGQELKKTGQVFKLANNSPINHCPKWEGDPERNPSGAIILAPKSEHVLSLVPQFRPIIFSCPIHPWMKAYVWVFDHPYSAVTDEDGKYTIPRVPTGVQLRLVAWHEADGYLQGGKEGNPITLKKDSVFDWKIKAK